MEFTAPRRTLLSAIEAALLASDQGSAMSILHSLRISAEKNGSLSVVGTDLLVSCTATTQATVKKPGATCAPAKLLRDVVARMKEGDLTISLSTAKSGSSLAVKGAGSRSATSIPTIPGEDYPSVPGAEGEPIVIPAASLASLFKITKPSMSTDQTRPHLACVCLEFNKGKVRAVSTDGHRLAKVERDHVGTGGPWLIPSAFLNHARLPDEGEVTLSAAKKDGPLSVAWGSPASGLRVVWTTKLVDAAYPSYQQVIPDRYRMAVTVAREELVDSVRTVSVASFHVVFTAKGDALSLVAEGKNTCEIKDSVPCEIGGGNDGPDLGALTIALTAEYVTQMLASIPGERVTLRLSGDLDPAVMVADGEPGFVGIIMPRRVEGA